MLEKAPSVSLHERAGQDNSAGKARNILLTGAGSYQVCFKRYCHQFIPSLSFSLMANQGMCVHGKVSVSAAKHGQADVFCTLQG